MIRIDFSEPSLLRRIGRLLDAAIPAGCERAVTVMVATFALLAVLGIFENWRLRDSIGRAQVLEERALATERRIAALETRARAIRTRRADLLHALNIRRSNVQRAVEIASIGNALPEDIALTTIRDSGAVWQVEGRSGSLQSVEGALRRLHSIAPAKGAALVDVHRDESRENVVTFSLEIRR